MCCSICDTVSPARSAAIRCLRSAMRDISPAPIATPSPRASRAATVLSSATDTTVTAKSYARGELHPSSVRPIWDNSQTPAQEFGWRSPSVCRQHVVKPPCGPTRLLGALARHRGRPGGRRLRIEVPATGNQRLEVVVEVVAQRDAGRDVQPDDV